MVLESCEIVEKTIDIHFTISFDYQNMNKVMRVIKEKARSCISGNGNKWEITTLPIGKTG